MVTEDQDPGKNVLEKWEQQVRVDVRGFTSEYNARLTTWNKYKMHLKNKQGRTVAWI